MSDPASRHKRPRDRGDSAVAPSSASAPRSAGAASSCSAVAKSTSERHTDSLAHLAAAYAAVDGYALAREEKAAQRAAGVFRDGIQYGEVSAASFARCLEWVTPVAGEVFYDLGSGTGKAVLTAAALHPLAAAYGIEIQPRLHEAALAARRAFEAIEGASLRAGRVTLQCGDAFAEDAAWPETADLVFCTTTCFTPELRAALERGVARLRVGARLIVTTLPFESPRLTLLRREALPYAKGSLQFFAYTVGN